MKFLPSLFPKQWIPPLALAAAMILVGCGTDESNTRSNHDANSAATQDLTQVVYCNPAIQDPSTAGVDPRYPVPPGTNCIPVGGGQLPPPGANPGQNQYQSDLPPGCVPGVNGCVPTTPCTPCPLNPCEPGTYPPGTCPGGGQCIPGGGTYPPGTGTCPGGGQCIPGGGTYPPGTGTLPPGTGTNPPGTGTLPPGTGTTPGGNLPPLAIR